MQEKVSKDTLSLLYLNTVSLSTLANVVYTDGHPKELGFGPNVCVELDFLAYTLSVEGRYCNIKPEISFSEVYSRDKTPVLLLLSLYKWFTAPLTTVYSFLSARVEYYLPI